MRVRVWLTALLAILLFILSHQTFPQTNFFAEELSVNCVKPNTSQFVNNEIKLPYYLKINIEREAFSKYLGRILAKRNLDLVDLFFSVLFEHYEIWPGNLW